MFRKAPKRKSPLSNQRCRVSNNAEESSSLGDDWDRVVRNRSGSYLPWKIQTKSKNKVKEEEKEEEEVKWKKKRKRAKEQQQPN